MNVRSDQYGGNYINRSRLTIEIAEAVSEAIGRDKVGIRFSPFSQLSDQKPYNEIEVHNTYAHLSNELYKIGIAYIHLLSNPDIPEKTYQTIRDAFSNTIIFSSGLTPETAEKILQDNTADLVAFGRSFLSNPDFVKRIENNRTLNDIDYNTLYTPGEIGYTDYPSVNFLD